MSTELGNINWKEIESRLRKAQALSRCKRLKVAAMSLYDLQWKVNGPSAGNECTGETGKCGCDHAEQRLLGVLGRPLKAIVVTHSPCLRCAEIIATRGITEVVYFFEEYRSRRGIEHLLQRGIECLKLN